MNPKQTAEHSEERQREMLSAVEHTLQDNDASMARSACLSRYHFQRVFERTVGEPPETFAVGRVIEESLSSGIAQRRVLEIMMEQMGFEL